MSKAVVENKDTALSNRKGYAFIWFICAVAGLTCGVILMLTGLMLSAVSYLEGIKFHGLELLLFAASFLLLGSGAHFLDLEEKARKETPEMRKLTEPELFEN